MKKVIKDVVKTTVMFTLILIPFYLPDSVVYIEKREMPIYNPVWEAWAGISMAVLGFFAGKGMLSIFYENKL